MKKILGWIGALIGFFAIGNAVYAFYQKLHFDKKEEDYDVVITCDYKKFDMSNENMVNKVAVVLGGVHFDFTQCFQYDIPYELDLTLRYGSATIVVPKGWFVKASGTITASGIENMTIFNEKENPEIRLLVNAQFAGVKITME